MIEILIIRKVDGISIRKRISSPNPVGMTTTKNIINIFIRNWAISIPAKIDKLSNIKNIAVLADPKKLYPVTLMTMTEFWLRTLMIFYNI